MPWSFIRLWGRERRRENCSKMEYFRGMELRSMVPWVMKSESLRPAVSCADSIRFYWGRGGRETTVQKSSR